MSIPRDSLSRAARKTSFGQQLPSRKKNSFVPLPHLSCRRHVPFFFQRSTLTTLTLSVLLWQATVSKNLAKGCDQCIVYSTRRREAPTLSWVVATGPSVSSTSLSTRSERIIKAIAKPDLLGCPKKNGWKEIDMVVCPILMMAKKVATTTIFLSMLFSWVRR